MLKLDYYVKQEEQVQVVSDLDALILASSPSSEYVTDETFSFIAGDGSLVFTSDLAKQEVGEQLSLLPDRDETHAQRVARQRLEEREPQQDPIYHVEPNEQQVDQFKGFIDSLFPPIEEGGDEEKNIDKINEAAEEVGNAAAVDYPAFNWRSEKGQVHSLNLPDTGFMVGADTSKLTAGRPSSQAQILPVDPSDFSQGWNVYKRPYVTTDTGHATARRSLDLTSNIKPLNKQPIRNFTNAYHAATQVVRKDVGQRGHKPILSIGHKEPGTEEEAEQFQKRLNRLIKRKRINQNVGRAIRRNSKFAGTRANDALLGQGNINQNIIDEANDTEIQGRSVASGNIGFLGRIAASFAAGYEEGKLGNLKGGADYSKAGGRQQFWENNVKLTTKYGAAKDAYEAATRKADRLRDPHQQNVANLSAWTDFKNAYAMIDRQAQANGSSGEAVKEHYNKIVSGVKTVLPPSHSFKEMDESREDYGKVYSSPKLERKIGSLDANRKYVKLQPLSRVDPSLIDDPLQSGPKSVPEPEPIPEADPEGSGQPAEGEQLPLIPEYGQQGLPGMGVPGQPLAPDDPGVGKTQYSGQHVPSREREYKSTAPYGLPLYQGPPRGDDNSISTFYDKREAKKAKAQLANKAGLVVPGVGAGQNQPGYAQAVQGLQQQGRAIAAGGENEMAQQQSDSYNDVVEQVNAKAKRSQARSKMRQAEAGARVAKAKANEAEAKAEQIENDVKENIASLVSKLDTRIAVLNVQEDPKISFILEKLENTIDIIDRKGK